MKITRIETIPIRVPLKPEFAIRSGRGGAHLVSPFLLVKVHTNEGLIGLGEASCTPRWSGEDQVTAAHLIRAYLEPLLVGEDPTEVEELAGKFRLAFAANHFTRAAVEMALWDIAGKAEDLPVYEMLGGKVREVVPTKWSVSGVEPEKAAEIASWAKQQGYNAMKVKVGIDSAGDLARVKAIREAVGADMKIGVDANGGWTLAEAAVAIQKLTQFGIAFAEQPVAPEQPTQMAEVRRGSAVPIIADESVFTLKDARVVAALKAADVLSIYVGKAGGIAEAMKIAQFAQVQNLKCTVGSNLELGVGSAAMIHLALASRGINAEEFPCDIIGPLFYEADIVREPHPIKAGEVTANAKPGLGIELDDESVARYRVNES